MQHDSKSGGRAPLRIDSLAATLEQGIENEAAVLDLLVQAAAKGNPHPELWAKVHVAAARDDRFSELAFAYERLCGDRKFSLLPPAVQADALMHAAVFFADVFGDPAGARGYLERVMAIAPGRADAFAQLAALLSDGHEAIKLADLHVAAAAHRERGEQLSMLRRAIEILDAFPGEEERAIKINQQILKLEPGDPRARRALEERLSKAGRVADVAKLLEQAIAADPPPPEAEALQIRGRLISIYTTDLAREIERALPHVEEVLQHDPQHAGAIAAAEGLLARKAVAPRAAAALEGAYDRQGRASDAARMMSLQIEQLRGPKRVEVQKRLADLMFQKLGDLAGAHALCEGIVTADPADDRFRERYLSLSAALDKRLEATRALGRAATLAKEKPLRARMGVEMGELYVDLGDPRKARASFQQVIEGGADEGAVLRAARGLAKLCEKEKDSKGLAATLERLADIEPEAEAREEASEQLARLCEAELHDAAGAAAAYRRLIGTRREGPALEALERIYEASGAHAELAGVLERRAEAEPDRAAARELALRAAELRSTKLSDRGAAIEAWRRFVAAFGASREAHAQLLPLLEQERRWGDLAEALAAEAGLAAGPERAATLARLGTVRATRLGDAAGALAAYRQALSIDPTERTSRLVVEKMLAAGADDMRLAACAVLEPIARGEGAAALLLRVLEVKAELAGSGIAEVVPPAPPAVSVHEAVTQPPPASWDWAAASAEVEVSVPRTPPPPADLSPAAGPPHSTRRGGIEERLAALEEAVGLSEHEMKDARKALDLASRGLRLAVDGAPAQIARWIGEVERLTGHGSEAGQRAAALAGALGDRQVTSAALSHLARRAGEALIASGEAAEALAVYRRALAFEPSSPELIARVDELLREQGSPEERIALYREALAQPCEPARRRELLHAIGAIQRRDLGDLAAAAATYRAALADDADDAAAYEALLDTCAAAGAWNAVLEELSARLPRVPAEERTAHELRMAGAAARAGREDEAAARYREILAGGAPLGGEALAAIEELGRGIGDDALLRRVFERRVEVSVDPQDEALWLERLGDLSARGDMAAAAAAWRRAAALAEGPLGDGGRARRLHEQVLAALPEDRLAAARLLAIYQEQGAWERVPAVCEVLLDTAASAAEALAELSVLEEAARRARATDRFLAAAARLRARLDAEAQAPDVGGAEADPARRRVVEAAVARVLGADPDRQDEAAAAHRRLVESAPEGDTQAIEAFRAFLAESPESPPRRDDRRWLFGWVAARAPEGERVRALAAWAEWEEGEAGDRAAAAEIYARILEIDPDHDGALGSRARVLLDLGDFEGAARAIEARRDRSEGAARAALDVSLAALLFDRLDRPAEALAALAPALEAGAVDRAALDLVERALGRPEAQARAAELLERAEAAIEDGDAKVALLELLLVRGPQDPGARRRWYERLLERQEGTPERALDAALRAVAELPFEMSLWERAESLGRAGKQPERVIAAYTAALDAARPGSDPDALEELGRRAVEYHEEWFDAPETTIKLLSRLVELAPGSAWGFERLKLAYNAAERWEDLFTLYDGVLERTRDDRDRVFLLEDAATVARDLAGDPERTMKYLEALLPLRDDARARATLERLYERYGRHRPLIDLLQRDVPRLPADAAQKLRVRIALLWIEGVGDAPSALPIAEQMLEGEGFGAEGAPRGARPGAPSVNQGSLEAFDLLERILGATPAGQPARQRAAALLEGRYRAEGKPADLARVLEIQLEADDAGARPALLREIVRLRRDSLGDEAGAMDRLAELVELLPDAAEHRAELAELAARLGRHDEHARVLAAAAARAEDSARSIALLEEAATIRRDVLGDAAGAIDLLRRTFALAEEHGHAAAALGAARELDRLLAAGGRVAERCDVLDLLAARERDPAARRDALGELARLAARELGDDDRAIAAFTARLGDDGADLEALDGLVAILDQAGRFRELSAALDRRARVREAAGEGDDARRDLARVARLFERELEDPEQAVAIWIRIRAELGPDVESGEALATLHARAGRWAELVEIVEEEARAALGAGDAARAADLYRRLGDAHRDHTLVWERAVESYHRAHQAGRGRGGDAEAHAGGARAGLEALLGRLDLASGEHRAALVAATGALLEIAGSSDDWRARVALLEPRLATAESDEGRVEILREAAALLEQRGGDVGGAFDLIWRAFLISPGPDRPADLVRLADDAARWGTIAGALPDLERRDDVPAPTLRDLWRRVAAWHRDARADAAAAESAFERALAHEATNAEILFELAELQRRTRGPALVGTLLRLADATGGDLALYREAVETARDALGDAGRAREIAGRMLDLAAAAWIGGDAEELVHQPSAPSAAALWAVDALAGMLAAEGDRAGVVAICRRGAALPFVPAEQRRLRRTAAEAAELEEAISLYMGLFDEDPRDEQVGERLAELFRGSARFEELVSLRERQIEVCEDAERRVALRFDAAVLLAQAGDGPRSIAALRRNLEELPSHAPSAEKLAWLFESGGFHRDLVRLREEQASRREAAGDGAGAAELWLQAAALAERELGDVERAITNHRRAAALGATEALDSLARLLSGRGDHAAAAEALERLCAVATPEALPVETLRLADEYVAAGHPELARGCLERTLGFGAEDAPRGARPGAPSVRPEFGAEGAARDVPLRERLAGLYREAGAWVALAELIAGDAARAADPGARLALLREAADLHLTRGGSPAAAIPLLEDAIALSPEDLSLRLARSRALAAAGRPADAAEALGAILAEFGTRRPKERALVHYELARVTLATGDRARAMAELDLALRIDPAHPGALHELAGLALENGQLDRAGRTYRALLLVARRPRQGEAMPFSRSEILLALGEIARRQGEADRETEYIESAFEAAREGEAELRRFLEALRARGRHDLLARAIEGRLAPPPAGEDAAPGKPGSSALPEVSPAERIALLEELAALCEGPLARPEAALDARLRALELAPDAPQAHEAALELSRRQGQVERYTDLVSRLLDPPGGVPPKRAVALLLHLARALEPVGLTSGAPGRAPDVSAPSSPDPSARRAAEVYRRAERLLDAGAGEPRDARLDGVWRALEAIYSRLDDRAAQADILQKRAGAADSAGAPASDRADPRYRLAALHAADAAAVDRAIELLEQALEIHPDADRAEAILRDALRLCPTNERAVRLFERVARDAERPRALVDALVLLAAVADAASAEAAQKEAVRIARDLGDRDLAASILVSVIERDAAAWAIITLADLREEAGDLGAAADLRERAARASAPDEERALLLRVAALAAGPLADLPRAARLYEELRAREPAEREIWEPLAEVHRRSGDVERLSALLEETVPLVDSMPERCRLRLERARLLVDNDAEAATTLLRETLDEDPSQVDAAILLASLLERAGRTSELGELYALQIDAAKDRGDVPSILSLSMRLGALLEQRGDEHEALDVYHAAADWDGSNRDVLRAIVRLNLKREDSVDLTDSLDKLLQLEQGDEAVQLALQLSKLRAAGGDDAGAEQALEIGYAACPSSDQLREELAARYTAREAWHKLAELYALEADVRADAVTRAECLCRAAEILRQRADDAGAAADVLERALAVIPGDRDVLLALIDAATALGQHARAAVAISRVIEASPEDPWLYRSRAPLHEAMGDGERALADLERAYALGGDACAGELVAQLERALSRADETGEDTAAYLEDTGTSRPTSARDLRLRIADVLAHAGDLDRARAHLTELLRKDGKDRAALQALAHIEESAQRWDAASAVHRRLIALEDGDALVATALRLADACERTERLGDARGGLERALHAAPEHAQVRERLRALYASTGASRELAAMLLDDARAAADVQARFALLLRAGRLLIEAEDAPHAVAVLEEARGLRPDEQEASLLLVDACAAAGRRADARALLLEVIASHKGRRSKQLGAAYHRLARLEALEGHPHESLAALSKAFENDSQNGALAMELAGYALERGEHEIAARAFRAVTMMKIAPEGSTEGTTSLSRAVAYYHLGSMALASGDRRKARLMLDKAVAEDASLEAARALLEELKSG